MRKELIQLENILDLLQKAVVIFRQSPHIDDASVQEILSTVEEVNAAVYGCNRLSAFPFHERPDNFRSLYEQWLENFSVELQYRKSLGNKIDYEFHILLSHVAATSEDELIAEAVASLDKIRQLSPMMYEHIKSIHNIFRHLWGSLDLEMNDTDLINSRVHTMKCHLEDFCWLYNNLADYRSKRVLYGILRFWLTFDYDYKSSLKENNFDEYYDFDLLNCSPEECLVDLGAYNGDSVLSFIHNWGTYKRIYCYEMTPSSMKEMQNNLQGFDNIIYRQVAVGNTNGSIFMKNFAGNISSNAVTAEGNIEIPMVTLDSDISEPITFIKMDIEGSELEAMKGAEGHIRGQKPKLAVCSYHNNCHIFEIPKLMREYNPQYKLYMRYYGSMDNVMLSEFVTFAIP